MAAEINFPGIIATIAVVRMVVTTVMMLEDVLSVSLEILFLVLILQNLAVQQVLVVLVVLEVQEVQVALEKRNAASQTLSTLTIWKTD